MTRQTVTVLRLVGVLLAVAVVASLAGPAVSTMLQHTEESSHDLSAELTTLVVEGDVGRVEVRAAEPGESASARVTTHTGLSDAGVDVAERDGVATLRSDCQTSWFDRCSVDWEVVVPAAAAVTVRLAVGDIVVHDTAGSLDLRTDVGSVAASGVAGERLSAATEVGDVTVEAVRPPQEVTARTETGSAEVTVPDDGTDYRVSVTTSVGDVTNAVGSDLGSPRRIDVSSSVGDVSVLRAGP